MANLMPPGNCHAKGLDGDGKVALASNRNSTISRSLEMFSSQAWSPARFEVFELEGRPDPIICS